MEHTRGPKIRLNNSWGDTKLGIGTLVMVELGSGTSSNQKVIWYLHVSDKNG